MCTCPQLSRQARPPCAACPAFSKNSLPPTPMHGGPCTFPHCEEAAGAALSPRLSPCPGNHVSQTGTCRPHPGEGQLLAGSARQQRKGNFSHQEEGEVLPFLEFPRLTLRSSSSVATGQTKLFLPFHIGEMMDKASAPGSAPLHPCSCLQAQRLTTVTWGVTANPFCAT